ncbi:hypothetical protein PISL3812_06760 [Talaromyces islandicus]|uniref:Tautomerase cis-CaaD-like domain-containing protein n=1 Tax=Talaromyces islandicus TaxID=28573 RepID=A0A0U1M3Z2_TALIS|nr:hypothetical protein PISL3812_06760 [Talaromyces islandicus]
MPVWKVFHSSDTLQKEEEKQAIAQGATDFYTKYGLPAFYVHVMFFPFEGENKYTGGKKQSRFVVVEINHIARHLEPGNRKQAITIKEGIDKVMKPLTTEKGIHLEYCVIEGLTELWRINGVDPPEAFGPDEQEEAEKSRQFLLKKYNDWQ